VGIAIAGKFVSDLVIVLGVAFFVLRWWNSNKLKDYAVKYE
jgi:hypothetical protein